MPEEAPYDSTITFLGTAGARFMVSKQLTASGGMWLDLDGTEILIDPGPGSLVQSTRRKLDAEKLKAIILSHRHLDHTGDANIMVEAMTGGGFKHRGVLFAPSDAFNEEPVIYSYLRAALGDIQILKEGQSYSVGNITFSTPLRHEHPVETYGITFHTSRHTFSYIADTKYFDALGKSYSSQMIILNVVLVEPRDRVYHLSIGDAAQIISQIKPKVAILNHYGMGIWRAKPWEVAGQLTSQTGIRVVAARDGMKFHLSELDSSAP